MLGKILLVCIIVTVLSSCGAWSSTSEVASREEGAGEEVTAPAEARVAESTESTSSSKSSGAVQPTQNTTTEPAVGTSGMVSSANPYATRAGLEILSEGGNAFDAAVAGAATLNVVEPMMSGVGGYGAIAIYDAEEGKARVLHADSRMPATLDPAVFRPPTPDYAENRRGAKAISTPGNVNAWERLSEDYGNLEWRGLFEPAIQLADEGFVVDGTTAGWIGTELPAFPEYARN